DRPRGRAIDVDYNNCNAGVQAACANGGNYEGGTGPNIAKAIAPVKRFVGREWGSCVSGGAIGAAANAADPAGSAASGFALGCVGSVVIDVTVRWNQPAGNILIILSTGQTAYQLGTGRLGEAYVKVLLKALEGAFKP